MSASRFHYIVSLFIVVLFYSHAFALMQGQDMRCQGIIGQWHWFNGATVRCSSQGNCTATNGFLGTWKCLGSDNQFEIQWERGGQKAVFIDTLQLSDDETYLSGSNQYGGRVTARRKSPSWQESLSDIEQAGGRQSRFRKKISRQQKELVNEFGWPQAFLVTFVTEETDEYFNQYRVETWHYYNVLTSYSFINGQFSSSKGIDPFDQEIYQADYNPYNFHSDSTWDDIQDLIAITDFVMITPDDLGLGLYDTESINGVSIYIIENLILGYDEHMLSTVILLPRTY